MGDNISQRNIFGRNVVARSLALRTTGERWAFAKGVLASLVAGLLLHFIAGIG